MVLRRDLFVPAISLEYVDGMEKPIRDISINEFRNARKAIFKGIKNGFMDENLNELPHENTQQFP